MENKNDLQEILIGYKNNKLNYDDAVQRLDAFSKEGLIWWILNSDPQTISHNTKIDLLSEHTKSLPGYNPYKDIKM